MQTDRGPVQVVFWNRRWFVAAAWTAFALLSLPGLAATSGDVIFTLIIAVPCTFMAIWSWGWSAQLKADGHGVRLYSWLPVVRRWEWSEIAGLSVTSQRGVIPALAFAGLTIQLQEGRSIQCGEIAQRGSVEAAKKVAALVEQLEQLRASH